MGQLVILIIAIGIFFLCRELMCWYWKINDHLTNQTKMIDILQNIQYKLDQIEIKNKKLEKLDDISRQLDEINKKIQKD